MSSRQGPVASGTDGSDFLHRERVAPQYKISAVNKGRLKLVIFLHLSLVMLMLFRLSTSFFVMAGMRPPAFLQKLRLPRAQLWEYAWLMSAMASIFGLVAIRKNRTVLMKQFILGFFTFGFLPVVYAIVDLSDDLIQYWETRETKQFILGFPSVVLWNMFLAIAVQIHGFGVYFAWKLVSAWSSKGEKRA